MVSLQNAVVRENHSSTGHLRIVTALPSDVRARKLLGGRANTNHKPLIHLECSSEFTVTGLPSPVLRGSWDG